MLVYITIPKIYFHIFILSVIPNNFLIELLNSYLICYKFQFIFIFIYSYLFYWEFELELTFRIKSS